VPFGNKRDQYASDKSPLAAEVLVRVRALSTSSNKSRPSHSDFHANGPAVDFYAFLERLDGRCAATNAAKCSYRRRKAKNRYSARLKIKISVKEMQR
jgi:hypothetical protein